MEQLRGLLVLMALVSAASFPPSTRAQHITDPNTHARSAPVFYIGTNISAAAVSSAFQHHRKQLTPVRLLIAGVSGGAMMYAGQRLISTGRPALRLAGLETVALGASVARNISRGSKPLAAATLPVFPFYVTLNDGAPHVRVRVSAVALTSVVRGYARGRRPDLLQSFYTGAVVFPVRERELFCYSTQRGICNIARVGEHQFGVIAYALDSPYETRNHTISHELSHVSQDVRDAVLNAVPMSDYVLPKGGSIGRLLSRYVVVDVFLPFMAASSMLGPPSFDSACDNLGRFYECEAYALSP